jgi:hypothetical protein
VKPPASGQKGHAVQGADVVSLVGNLGIGGVLVWYLYYTTAKMLPAMQEAHANAMQELVCEFRLDLKEERQLRIAMHKDMQALLAKLSTRPCLLEKMQLESDGGG